MNKWISFFNRKKSSGIFIPNGDKYIELKDEISNSSINGITRYLGYEPIEAHVYYGDLDNKLLIHHVILEVFTENIIFVLVDSRIQFLESNQVKKFMKNFSFTEEYNILNVNDILLEGITERTLKLEFLSRVLNFNIESVNEIYLIKKLGINLSFVDGILVSFKLDNDLGEWARHFKRVNPDMVADYAKVSKMFWNDDYDMIFQEVNLQFESLASVPHALKNQFLHLHKNKYGTINFFMLLVCHYKQEMNLTEFETINKGRFVEIPTFNSDVKFFSLGKFEYEFDKNGILVNIKKKR